MIKGLYNKRLLNALTFTLVIVSALILIVERPLQTDIFQLSVRSSTHGTIQVGNKSETEILDQQFALEEGNKVFRFEDSKSERIILEFTDFELGDTIKFHGLKYENGPQIKFWDDPTELPGFQMDDVDYESQDTSFYVTNNSFKWSFSGKDIRVNKTVYWLKRGAIYSIIFFLLLVFLYKTLSRIDHIRWKQIVIYQLFGFTLAVLVYMAFRGFTSYPNRTEVKLNWTPNTDVLYKVQHLSVTGSITGGGEMTNAANRYAAPMQFLAEQPFHSFRIQLSPNTRKAKLESVELRNAFFTKTIDAAEIKNHLSLHNDLVLTHESQQKVLKIQPSGPNPYAELASPQLWWFRLADKLLYRLHVLFCVGLWLFTFLLLIILQKQKRVKGVRDVWFGLIFLAALFLPGSLWLISTPPAYLVDEKRKAVPADSLFQGELREWPDQVENYLGDHFGARSSMIEINNYYKVKVFNDVTSRDNTVIANGDWLFLEADGSGDIIRNEVPISDVELKIIAQNLIERQKWLAAHGTEFYMAFVPIKSSIYPEKVPDELKPVHTPSSSDAIIEYLKKNTDLNIIDLKPKLLREKEGELLYYKRDTHWNFLGAYHAHEVLIDSLNNQYPQIGDPIPLDQYEIQKSRNNQADLTRLLGVENVLLRDEVYLSPNFNANVQKVDQNFNEVMIKTQAVSYINHSSDNDLNIMYFRDSYTNYLISFLNNYSRKSTYLWTTVFPVGAFEKGYPDMVVYILSERLLPDLIYANSPKVKEFSDTDGLTGTGE